MSTGSASATTWVIWLSISVVVIEGLLFLWLRPSLRTALIFGAASVAGIVGSAVLLFKLEAQTQFTQFLAREGVRGSARIMKIQATHIVVSRRPQVRLWLKVQLPGRAPYELEQLELLPFVGYGVAPDRVVSVLVDPGNPQSLMIDWTTAPVSADSPDSPADEPDGDASIAVRLERLDDLRHRGLISDQEYHEERQRLLAEL